MSQDPHAVTLSLDAWLHVLSHLSEQGLKSLIPLMMTCNALRTLGMPTLINSSKIHDFRMLKGFLGLLLADPVIRIPMLRRLDWTCNVSRRVGARWARRDRESDMWILGTLADVLEQAYNLQVINLDVSTLEEEPRIIDALISGCPKVHTVLLHLPWEADKTRHNDILARLFDQVRWPLRAVNIESGKPEMVPLLARFAGTLEELRLTECPLPFGWADMPIFPRVSKLQISYWRSYHRTPIVKAFPAVVHLEAYTSLSAAEYKEMWLVDMAESLDEANLTNPQPSDGWQHLDHVEGNVLFIHALTVPSVASVRRLCLEVDLDHPESVKRLCSTLEALRPTVLELVMSSQDGTDATWLWNTRTLDAMASVRYLVFETVRLRSSAYRDGVLELYAFSVR
jgi:hypothetical protein